MNLGAILHINNKLEAAERSYLRALEIEPNHETTHQNLRKLRSLMNKEKKKTKWAAFIVWQWMKIDERQYKDQY